MANLAPELKTKLDETARNASTFINLYYDKVDKQRHMVSRFYLDNGVFVWNGNESIGVDKIQKYHSELPPTEHTVNTLDAQPVIDDAVSGTPTYLIQTSGTVRYSNQSAKTFQQTFMMTAIGDKWKIASDCFRQQDALCLQTAGT